MQFLETKQQTSDNLTSSQSKESCTAGRPLFQRMYICDQCFENQQGICHYCYENCHKKQGHICKLRQVRALFSCECGSFRHRKSAQEIHQCFFSPLQKIIQQPYQYCINCRLDVCYFCQLKHHQGHIFQPSLSNKCECSSPHIASELNLYIRKELRQLDKQHILESILTSQLCSLLLAPTKSLLLNMHEALEGGDPNFYIWITKAIDHNHQSFSDVLNAQFNLLPLDQIINSLNLLLALRNDQLFYTELPLSLFTILIQNQHQLHQDTLAIEELLICGIKLQTHELLRRSKKLLCIQDIQNTNPDLRQCIARANQYSDPSLIHELTSNMKKYQKIYKFMDANNPLFKYLLYYNLKAMQLSLSTCLISNNKFITKFLQRIEIIFQNILQYDISPEIFDFLSQVLVFFYFQLNQDQIDSPQHHVIYTIMVNLLIKPNIYRKSWSQKVNQQLRILLREQMFSNAFVIVQGTSSIDLKLIQYQDYSGVMLQDFDKILLLNQLKIKKSVQIQNELFVSGLWQRIIQLLNNATQEDEIRKLFDYLLLLVNEQNISQAFIQHENKLLMMEYYNKLPIQIIDYRPLLEIVQEVFDSIQIDNNMSEISLLRAFNNHKILIEIIEIQTKILKQLAVVLQSENEFQNASRDLQFLNEHVLSNVIDHLLEVFILNCSQLMDSSYENIFNHENQYSKYTFSRALQVVSSAKGKIQNQKPDDSFYSIDSSIDYQIDNLKQALNMDLTVIEKLSVATVLLASKQLEFLSIMIDVSNRFQIIEYTGLGEQTTMHQKIDQIYSYVNQGFKLSLDHTLEDFPEIKIVIEKFIQLMAFVNSEDFTTQPPKILSYERGVQYQELPFQQMEQNCLINLIRQEYRNRTKSEIGISYVCYLIDLMEKQSIFCSRNNEYPYQILMEQMNAMKVLLRLLTVETKAVQALFAQLIKEDQFVEQFNRVLLQISTETLQKLFSHVIYFQEHPYIQIVISSGNCSIVILELLRYMAEGQNRIMQEFVGSRVLESLLNLLVEILQSEHIQEILRETKMMRKNEERNQRFPIRRLHSNEFLQMPLHNKDTGHQIAPVFLRLYAHTVITITEYNQGQCLANQIITFKILTEQKVWQTVVQILTAKVNIQSNGIYTLRMYLFELILSLLENPDLHSQQYIMSTLTYKLLEETLTKTYTSLMTFNQFDSQNLELMQQQLTEKYRTSLGDNINDSLIFDSKILIKILYQIYKILHLYATSNREIQRYLDMQLTSINQNNDDITKFAFKFIHSIVGSVELIHQGQIEVFHFLIPPMCFFLSAESKLQFLTETVDRSNPSSKIASILEVIPEFMTEMRENMSKYRKSDFQRQLIRIAISPLFHHKRFAIALTVLNFIVLLLVANNHQFQIANANFTYVITNQLLLTISQLLLLISSVLALACQLFFRMSIYYKLASTSNIAIINVFLRRDIFQFSLHVICSLLGLIEPFFFYLQSFCFIYISKTMYSVLEALRLRWSQFLGIFTMLLIILNAYSYIGFRKFTTSFQNHVVTDSEIDSTVEELLCDTPVHCFISLVYFGLRESAGIGAYGDQESYYHSPDYFPRFIYDFSFFLIVTLIMLNIINGIIIDTFADLRDQQQRNDYDTNNVCMVCSLERWQFDKKGISFEKHVEETHNLWNYFAFIVHLQTTGKENMNGIETEISKRLHHRDMSWVPQQQTRKL